MNRSDLQQLSKLRLEEAQILMAAQRPGGAYYLAGYAVECALKACIAKKVRQHDFPEKNTVLESYVHNLAKLVRVADLEAQLNELTGRDAQFAANWDVVRNWSEQSRYELTSATDADALIDAMTDSQHGVMPWIEQHW